MPADDGLRLHEDEGALPVGPQAAERDPECSVSVSQLGAFGLVLQNGQLLSQSEVLQSELALRLQARSSRRKPGVQQVNHWVGQRDPERGNVNDCVVDEVLRRHTHLEPDTYRSLAACALRGATFCRSLARLGELPPAGGRVRMRCMYRLLSLTVLLAACGGDDHGGDQLMPTNATCPSGSTLTYEGFGQPFVESYCTRCHSSELSGADRNGAPDGHDFDSLEGILSVADHVDQYAAAGPDATNEFMPPSDPRPSLAERQMLGEWLACEMAR
jgi:cytochrome c5